MLEGQRVRPDALVLVDDPEQALERLGVLLERYDLAEGGQWEAARIMSQTSAIDVEDDIVGGLEAEGAVRGRRDWRKMVSVSMKEFMNGTYIGHRS